MTTESHSPPSKHVVLVGLMGSGKSSVGRRLGARLGFSFLDADDEIEVAAGLSIPDIFEVYGEAAFRDVEVRVIQRLLSGSPAVIAYGGGAFMDPDTRAATREHAISVWLRAELDVLLALTQRRDDRPLLQTDNPRAVLERLIDIRYPVYAEADLHIDTGTENIEHTVDLVVDALVAHTPTDSGSAIADEVAS